MSRASNLAGFTTSISPPTNLSVGIITATSFFGSGANLTGVGLGTTGSINTSGIITATSFSGSGANLTGVGLGTTGSINTSGIITATSIVVSAGTTALPSISPTGDSNTGIFFPSADTIAVSTGGTNTERLRIQADGVIAIKFSGTPDIQLSKGPINTGTQSIAIGQAMASATGSDNCVAIGGVGCAPALTTGDANTFVGAYTGNIVATGQLNAHFGYNLTSSSSSVSNEYIFGAGLTGKGTGTAFIAGAAYQGNNLSTWSTTSDQRLKKNISVNAEGLDKIAQIRVVNFEYRLPFEIEDEDISGQALVREDDEGVITGVTGVQLGVIAQELQEICPDCVKTESTGVLSVVTDSIFWHLVNAVKELSDKNAVLESRLTALEGN